eukprot:3370915-Lingulodinium_polyedra.AAC.1
MNTQQSWNDAFVARPCNSHETATARYWFVVGWTVGTLYQTYINQRTAIDRISMGRASVDQSYLVKPYADQS